MSELNDIIGAIISLFVIIILGYIFFTVLNVISPNLAAVFVLLIVIVAVGVLVKLFRG